MTSNTIPVTLLHPVFGQFLDDCKTHRPVAEDNRLVSALSKVMSNIDRDEQQRDAKIMRVFADHGMDLGSTDVLGTNAMTDRDNSSRRHPYAIAVVKREVWYPGADQYFGGGQHYLESARNVAIEMLCFVIHPDRYVR